MKQILQRAAGMACVLLPLCVLLATQWRGVDFGTHWDEWVHFECVRRTVQTGIFLPGWYNYPSVPYWITLVATAPELIRGHLDARPDYAEFQIFFPAHCRATNEKNVGEWARQVGKAFGSHAHHMRVRLAFISVSALAVIWVYLAVVAMGYRRREACLASCLLAFSWEVAYHSRFIAPDAIMMQFAALTSLFCMQIIMRHWSWMLVGGAAVSAALATGAKYTAGLTLIPVMAAALSRGDLRQRPFKAIGIAAGVLALFSLTFLFTTPAAILEPFVFWRFLTDLIDTGYSDGWFGHTVQAGWPHLGMNLQWLVLCLLSRYKILSLCWTILAGVGAWALWRRSRAACIVFLIYPVVHVAYMSLMWSMIVRNLLVAAPFLAALSALGALFVYDRLKIAGVRLLWSALIMGSVLVNAGWLVQASHTIAHRQSDRPLRELASYLDARPKTAFALSAGVQRQLSSVDRRDRSNVVENADAAHLYCAYHRELYPKLMWLPANDPFMTVACFGPMEVNMNYYPDWTGEDHILVIKTSKMDKLIRRGKEMRQIMKERRAISGRPEQGL